MTPDPTSPGTALVDVLDQLLDTGLVLDGQIVLSVAGVDLVHVGLRALVSSVDTAARLLQPPAARAEGPPAALGEGPPR